MIKLNGVGRKYGEVAVLSDINLEIGEGEFVVITGESGSGKSTLMQIMGCLERPSSGEVWVCGEDVKKLSEGALSEFRNKKLGFVFQAFYLQPFLTVKENVMVPMMFEGMKSEEMRKRAEEKLAAVGMMEWAERLPSKLSGGQIQRVAIARALVNEPRIILADEPTGNLDAENGRMVVELFKQIRRELGTTIVVVTHDLAVAAEAERMVRLSRGRLMK